MSRKIQYTVCLVIISVGLAFNAPVLAARPKVLPAAVRLVLIKTNAMLQKKEYSRALETLLAFEAKGAPSDGTNKKDTKGYHHPEIYYCLGNCYMLQKQYSQAIAAFSQSVARDPKHTFAWLNLAKANYELTRYADAGRCFGRGYDTASKKKPEHLYYSAVSYFLAEDHQKSIRLFDQLLSAHAASVKPEWKENLVHALMAADQQRRALPYIKELAQVYTGDKKIRWQEILLYQYVKLEMHGEALAYANLLTEQAPTISKWWKALTHIQLNGNRYEDALAALTVYSFLEPLSRAEKKLLADLNLQLGIPVKATPVYEDILDEKTEKKLLQRLALAYRQLGRADTALMQIEAYQHTPNDTDLMLLKGELHYLLKQYDKAATAYRAAAKNKGKHAGRAWLMAGYAAWQMDDLPASRRAFAKAGEHARQKKAAATALRQLARLSVQKSQQRKVSDNDSGS